MTDRGVQISIMIPASFIYTIYIWVFITYILHIHDIGLSNKRNLSSANSSKSLIRHSISMTPYRIISIYDIELASFISTSAQTTSFGSNQSGSSQSSSEVNELKLDVTTNFGVELFPSSSSPSFSDLVRFRSDLVLSTEGMIASVCSEA